MDDPEIMDYEMDDREMDDREMDIQPMDIDDDVDNGSLQVHSPQVHLGKHTSEGAIADITQRVINVFSSLNKLKEEKSLDTKAWIEINKILQKDDSQFSVNRSGPLFDFKQYIEKPHIIDELDNFLQKNEERQTYLKALSVPHFKQPSQLQTSTSTSNHQTNTMINESKNDEKKMLFRIGNENVDITPPQQSTKTENEYYAYLLKKIKKCGNKSVIHYKLKSATSYNPSGTGTFTAPVQDNELEELEDVEKVEGEDVEEISSLEEYTDDIELSEEEEELEEEELEESVNDSNQEIGEGEGDDEE